MCGTPGHDCWTRCHKKAKVCKWRDTFPHFTYLAQGKIWNYLMAYYKISLFLWCAAKLILWIFNPPLFNWWKFGLSFHETDLNCKDPYPWQAEPYNTDFILVVVCRISKVIEMPTILQYALHVENKFLGNEQKYFLW